MKSKSITAEIQVCGYIKSVNHIKETSETTFHIDLLPLNMHVSSEKCKEMQPGDFAIVKASYLESKWLVHAFEYFRNVLQSGSIEICDNTNNVPTNNAPQQQEELSAEVVTVNVTTTPVANSLKPSVEPTITTSATASSCTTRSFAHQRGGFSSRSASPITTRVVIPSSGSRSIKTTTGFNTATSSDKAATPVYDRQAAQREADQQIMF